MLADVKPGGVLTVLAFAGTGKTTCLRAYAQARPHLKILYLTVGAVCIIAILVWLSSMKLPKFLSFSFEESVTDKRGKECGMRKGVVFFSGNGWETAWGVVDAPWRWFVRPRSRRAKKRRSCPYRTLVPHAK